MRLPAVMLSKIAQNARPVFHQKTGLNTECGFARTHCVLRVQTASRATLTLTIEGDRERPPPSHPYLNDRRRQRETTTQPPLP